MPARKMLNHDTRTREKIRTSQLINRLTNHVLGKVELSASQVTAALGLIRKTLPDLAAIEVKAEVTQKTVSHDIMGEKEWEKTYGGNLEAAERAAEKPH